MGLLSEDIIRRALEAVVPTDAGRIGDVRLSGSGEVLVMIEVDPSQGPSLEPLRQEVERSVLALEGVSKVSAVLTAERAAPDPHGMGKNPRLENLHIRKIIAVASGKGGVGKSTVAVNLAYALAQTGMSVGLLDADIYGPSVPMLTGTEGQKPEFTEQQNIIPLQAHGLKIMSIGFMLKTSQALIWRGPMVQSALYQMLRDVVWGSKDAPLDVLIVDMPPGTGDAQLTLAQKVPVDGAVIVSTPQDIALIDARKAIEMFRKVGVPILGLIENMSFYHCPNCGHEEHIFGHGEVECESSIQNVSYLGSIPLQKDIRLDSDQGKPKGLDAAIVEKILAAPAFQRHE